MAEQVVDVRSVRRRLERLQEDASRFTTEQVSDLEKQILACEPEDSAEFQKHLMGAIIREQRRTIRDGLVTFLLAGIVAILSLFLLVKIVAIESPVLLVTRLLHQPLGDVDAAFSLLILAIPPLLLGLFSLYLLRRIIEAAREISLVRRFQAANSGPLTISAYRAYRQNARSFTVSLRNREYRWKFSSTKRKAIQRISEVTGIEREDLERLRAVQAAYFLFENRYIQNSESRFINEVLPEECKAFRHDRNVEKFLRGERVQNYLYAPVE